MFHTFVPHFVAHTPKTLNVTHFVTQIYNMNISTRMQHEHKRAYATWTQAHLHTINKSTRTQHEHKHTYTAWTRILVKGDEVANPNFSRLRRFQPSLLSGVGRGCGCDVIENVKVVGFQRKWVCALIRVWRIKKLRFPMCGRGGKFIEKLKMIQSG